MRPAMDSTISDFDPQSFITDGYLQSVLENTTCTRKQCLELIDQVAANPVVQGEELPRETQLEFSKQQKTLYSYLAQLRGMNRASLLKVRNTKQQTAEAKQEIDRLHLSLQNLYYEEMHLRGEIAACESYDHTYQQLPLIPAEDFLAKKPVHAADDERTLMFARINQELVDREALEQQRQGLLKKKQTLMAGNKKRKDDLASLDQDLEKFIDAARPIQAMFEK